MVAKNNRGDASNEEGVKKRARKSSTNEKGYATYLAKVFKQVTEGKKYTISSKAMEVVNSLVEDLENRMTNKSFELAKFAKKSTLAAPHIQTAAKLVFPSDMGGMAISEGTKALSKYTSSA